MMESRSIRTLVVAALIAATPNVVAAQKPNGRVIRGMVYDSLTESPLGGAHVMLLAQSDSSHASRSTDADSSGKFEIAGLRGGVYLIGFDAPLLDSLGVRAAPRQIQLAPTADKPLTVTLAVPSQRTLRDTFCPHSAATDSSSLLIGHLVDPSTVAPISNGIVTARWLAISKSTSRVAILPATEETQSSAGGWFGLCGLPAGRPVDVLAVHGTDTSAVLTVTPPDEAAVLRHRIYLTPATAPHTGRVSGLVSDANDGRPIPGATVTLAGSDRRIAIGADGRFSLTDLPYGTGSFGVSHTGYQPQQRPVDVLAVAGAADSITISLLTQTDAQDTAVAAVARTIADAHGFYKRKAMQLGRHTALLDYAALAQSNAPSLSELAASVWGIRVVSSDSGAGPVFAARVPVGMRKGVMQQTCVAALFVDGVLQRNSRTPPQVDEATPLDDMAAVEIYGPDAGPAEFIDTSRERDCGEIVVWLLPQSLWHGERDK
jgi:hypothetical protein